VILKSEDSAQEAANLPYARCWRVRSSKRRLKTPFWARISARSRSWVPGAWILAQKKELLADDAEKPIY
jgi:hypothetical protein